jgi:hypothetical protein
MLDREKDIQEAMAQGVPVRRMCDDLAVKHGVQSRSIYNQYLQMVKEIKQSVLEGREELRANLMARNDYIYVESLKAKNLKLALEATTAQAKLAGLGEKTEAGSTKPEIITVRERGPTPLTIVQDVVNGEE